MFSLIPDSLRMFIGAFIGVLISLGGTWTYGQSFRENRDHYFCCAKQSLQLEKMDALSSESIKSVMRSRADPSEELAHDGTRYINEVFNGIWWMDGNPGPEELATMADGYVQTGAKPNPYTWIYMPTLDLEGGTWAYPDNILGRSLFVTQCVLDVRPQMRFTEDEQKLLYQGPVGPENEMYYIDEHTYSKPILNGQARYTLRRIIDANGEETTNWPIWATYTKKRSRPNVLSFRRRGEGERCHADFL